MKIKTKIEILFYKNDRVLYFYVNNNVLKINKSISLLRILPIRITTVSKKEIFKYYPK